MAFFGLSFDFLFNQLRNGSNGSLAGGTVTFYAAGTTTPKAVWTNRAMTLPSVAGVLTPYPLTADGTATLYGAGVYKVVVKNASGVTVFTYDDFECTSPTVTDNIADTLVNVVSLTSPAQAQIDTKLTKVVTSSTSTGTAANAGTSISIGATESGGGTSSSVQAKADGNLELNYSAALKLNGTALTATGAELNASAGSVASGTDSSMAITGLTTTPAITINYTITGKVATIFIAGASGTSNSAAMTLTGLPAILKPGRTGGTYPIVLTRVEDDGVWSSGVCTINITTGVITFFKDITGAAFTATGTKGFSNVMATYLLA